MLKTSQCPFVVFILWSLITATARAEVRIWEEDLVLPAYRLGEPDPNPMFYRGESYQGAQKRIYPYSLMDGITADQQQQTLKAVYLENEYVKLCVLPEIGGRLFYATDKTNGYEFFYRQHVVKPALIGMLGAWVSGGVEWCVFHHHRNTTHMPVDYTLQENPDGSKTVWIGETERRHRMRWMIGITLHPGRSYLDVKVNLINRTAQPHSILYWANVAVHVNDQYQIIFPPSVQVATYHAKNDFVHWPIGQGRYQGQDYTSVDLSWWKNHPRPVSCFAWDLREDFMGGYDHRADAGVVHVGNHHVVCGAKLWEWAPGNIWDTKILTDSDGPYAELMVGAFSDNQPDYSWIKPYEVKRFTQYWYPVRQIGGFKNANLNAAVNLQVRQETITVGFHVTRAYENAHALLKAKDQLLLERTIDISPGQPFVQELAAVPGVAETDLQAVLTDQQGNVLISYRPVELEPVDKLPETVQAPPAPAEIKTIEELYLTGLRVQQIYKPSIDPMDYFGEALKRDPQDVRTNTAVGILYNQKGMHQQAEEHLRRAVQRMTTDYTRAINTEAHYCLGLALKAQGKHDEACDLFYQATWDYAQRSASYYQLATLSCRKGQFSQALEEVRQALETNTLSAKMRTLEAVVLRRLGRVDRAQELISRIVAADPLNFWARNELYLLQKTQRDDGRVSEAGARLAALMRNDVQNWLELATDYLDCGLWEDADDVLDRGRSITGSEMADSPLVAYYRGYLQQQLRLSDAAGQWYATAAALPHAYCFPFRQESADILQAALAWNPRDARACYYLGNLYYDQQPEKAVELWKRSSRLDPGLAVVHRNLGWASLRHEDNVGQAIAHYEKAIEADGDDPRYYQELDDLYQQGNTDPARRLAVLETTPEARAKRKSLLIRYIHLLVATGDYDKAIAQLTTNRFFISEGGGRELGDAYVDAYLLRGLRLLQEGQAQQALADFQAASVYPENLSQESSRNEAKVSQVAYCLAQAYRQSNDTQRYREALERVVQTAQSSRGNRDAQFYLALALIELGRTEDAAEAAKSLVDGAARQLEGGTQIDYFAKFGQQSSRQSQRADAHYQLGLGLLLQGKTEEARNQFEQALNYNKEHVWAGYQYRRL